MNIVPLRRLEPCGICHAPIVKQEDGAYHINNNETHIFHPRCLRKIWDEQQNQEFLCPTCRRPVTDIDEQKIDDALPPFIQKTWATKAKKLANKVANFGTWFLEGHARVFSLMTIAMNIGILSLKTTLALERVVFKYEDPSFLQKLGMAFGMIDPATLFPPPPTAWEKHPFVQLFSLFSDKSWGQMLFDAYTNPYFVILSLTFCLIIRRILLRERAFDF